MKIDILMATYNGEKYLREQLDSILNQTYSDFRLLISDDNSQDSTRDVLSKYAERDNRIIVFLQDKNLGVTKNFEFLMQKVENEYFMFADQDDIWQKDKIQKSIKKSINEDCDLVYSNLEVVNQDLQLLNKSYWKLKGFEKKIKNYNNFNSLYLNNYITGCTMLVKSKWLKKILPIPHKSKYILHDYWTALIVSYYGKMGFVDDTLVKYRQHIDNEVGSKRKTDSINHFEEMRNLFIDVKIDHFKNFIEKRDVFDNDEINSLNKKAYEYYKGLEKVKKISFRGSKLFWKLYKYEEFNYAFQNYLILNMPILAKPLFKIKKIFSKKK